MQKVNLTKLSAFLMLICMGVFANFLIEDSISGVDFDHDNVENVDTYVTPLNEAIEDQSGMVTISASCYDADDNYLGYVAVAGGAYINQDDDNVSIINYWGWIRAGVANAEIDGNSWVETTLPSGNTTSEGDDIGLNHPLHNLSVCVYATESEPLADALNGRSADGYADLLVFDEDGEVEYFGFVSCDISLP